MQTTVSVRAKLISEAKRDFSKIVRETVETGMPTFIFNRNRLEAVILSNDVYEELIRKCREMEAELRGDKERRYVIEFSDD